MPRQPEARLTQRILRYVRARGGRWMKIHGSDNSYQEAGISDILGCYRGCFVAIEVKQPGGKLSRLQELFLKEVHLSGGYTLVAETLQDVEALLERIDKVERRPPRRSRDL